MRAFRRKGIRPIPVNIHWKYKTMSNYVEEFLSQVIPRPYAKVSVFGFSFGAMIAMLAAKYIKPDRLYLASLSPYFNEDLKHLSAADQKVLGKKRLADFKKNSFRSAAKNVSCPVFLMVGECEPAQVKKRVQAARHKLKHTKVVVIKEAGHLFSDDNYIKCVIRTILKR